MTFFFKKKKRDWKGFAGGSVIFKLWKKEKEREKK